MKYTTYLFVALLSLFLMGCDERAENIGEDIDDRVEELGDTAEDVGEEIDDKVEDVGDKAEDVVDNLEDKVE